MADLFNGSIGEGVGKITINGKTHVHRFKTGWYKIGIVLFMLVNYLFLISFPVFLGQLTPGIEVQWMHSVLLGTIFWLVGVFSTDTSMPFLASGVGLLLFYVISVPMSIQVYTFHIVIYALAYCIGILVVVISFGVLFLHPSMFTQTPDDIAREQLDSVYADFCSTEEFSLTEEDVQYDKKEREIKIPIQALKQNERWKIEALFNDYADEAVVEFGMEPLIKKKYLLLNDDPFLIVQIKSEYDIV